MFIREASIYNLVRLLGKLWTSEKHMQQAELLLHEFPNIDATTLLNLTKIQRVTPQVYHNLQTLKAQGFIAPFLEPFLSQIQTVLEEKKEYICLLLTDLEAFAEAAGRTGTQFMAVKGTCFQQLYPNESFRDMWDIDLVISQETVWNGIDAFRQIQHLPKRIRLESYPYSKLKLGQVTEGTFGIAEMLDLDGDPRYYPFDLHLGGFPGCGDGLLELNLWKRAIPLKVGNQEILMPSLEDCILIICSHTSRHGYAKLRDLNDIHVCLRHAADDFDWDYLFHFSGKNSLQAILCGLLDRLRNDSEVEVPKDTLSSLKPKGFEIFTSKTLFLAGKANPNFHGGRQLIFGRFLQASFLYNYYRERTGFFTALKETVSALYFLFQSGRPYRLWKQRCIRSFHSDRRLVMIPIEASKDKACWQIERIHLQKIESFALKSGIPVEWISNEIIVWNVGHPNELIFTPEGIYTQSAYNGNINEAELEKTQRVAWAVVTQLKEVSGIDAKHT